MTTATQEAPRRNELAQLKDSTVGAVEKRINQLVGNHQLTLPPGYNAGNALQAAWLALQEVKDRNGKLALEVCSRNSITQSLFSMVVQGLDVGLKQGYFITYGQSLTFQRSYFGTEAVAKRLGVKAVYAEVIYEGDQFEYEIDRGQKRVTRHVQSFDNVDPNKIKGAYAVVTFRDESLPEYTEIMTWDQIQKAWAKGQGNNPARREFPDEMSKRTILNRALKRFINSSSNDPLLVQEFNRSASEAAVLEVEGEAHAQANQQLIDVDAPEPVIEDERTIDVEYEPAQAAPVEDFPDENTLFPAEDDPGF